MEGFILQKVQVVVICLALAVLACCQPSPISLTPLPSRIDRMEGHASLTISGEQGASKSKFSFLFQLPSRGRIDVTGALGRIVYRIVIYEGEAYFIVPSKKVYWQSQEEEIIDKFVGFRLNLTEMINLLSGDWNDPEGLHAEGVEGWSFAKDQDGRIISGQRQDLWFEIEEFIGETSFARRLRFKHALNTGQVKVLSLGLNRPIKPNVFSTKFIEKYQPKTWAEIQEMLNHAH
jgi:hypothetical protein